MSTPVKQPLFVPAIALQTAPSKGASEIIHTLPLLPVCSSSGALFGRPVSYSPTHLSVVRTMHMAHYPLVVVATSSDSVTLAGARIALVGGERAPMPEVGEASPGGGSVYLPTTLPPVPCHPGTYCTSNQKGRTKPNHDKPSQNKQVHTHYSA